MTLGGSGDAADGLRLRRSETHPESLILEASAAVLERRETQPLLDRIDRLLAEGPSGLVVDCRRLTSISSLGIGALIALWTHLRRHGGNLRLAAVSDRIVETLRITGLERIFEVYDDVDEALAAPRLKLVDRPPLLNRSNEES